MKRFVSTCVGIGALALGISIVPAASVAATAAPASQIQLRSGTVSLVRVVNALAVSRAAASHPAAAAPVLARNAGALASARAAAVSSGGRRTGVTEIGASPRAAQPNASPATLHDFATMSQGTQATLNSSLTGIEPPDTQVAAGPTSVVNAVNSTMSVWSKTGGNIANVDLSAFFLVPSGFAFSDPRILYDSQSGRWFLSGLSFNVATTFDSQTYLAVSQTSDPTGNWAVYTVASSPTMLSDQPMTGFCNDKVVMAWNEFSSTAFTGSTVIVLQKSSLVAGTSVNIAGASGLGEFRFAPAQSLSPTSTCYIAVNDADPSVLGGPGGSPTLGVYGITGTPNQGNVSFGTESHLGITATSPPPVPSQIGGALNNTSNDDRLLGAVWQDGRLWTSLTDSCTPSGDTAARNCMRLIDVNTSGSKSVVRDTDLSTNGVDEYYPAVSLSYNGDLYVSYTASSLTQDPGAYAIVSQSAGTTFSAPVTVHASTAAYNDGGTSPRWGDYSGAAPDPAQPGAVWVGAEYATSDGATPNWGTAAAELTLASSTPAVAVAALGPGGVPSARAPQLGGGTSWVSLGGTVIAPPAVAAVPNPDGTGLASPLFIAPGTNHLLYIRGVAGSWKALTTKNASCLAVGAVVTTSGTTNTLTLACEGLNHALYYNQATVPSSGLPVFNNAWKGLGGTMSAAPAVAPVNGTLLFFVRTTTGKIDTRTLTSGFAAAPWTCLGTPAAAAVPGTLAETFFACEGTNHGLYVSMAGGASWGPTVLLSGTLAAGPAVAPTSTVPELVVEGSGGTVYQRTPSTGFTKLTGITASGVEAAALN